MSVCRQAAGGNGNTQIGHNVLQKDDTWLVN